jgi:hypothetical protein
MTTNVGRLTEHYPLKLAPTGLRVLLRARVWLRHGTLDRRLADGANPALDPLLELRADQLTHMRVRELLANTIERALAEAEAPRRGLSAAIPARRSAMRDARREIAALIERLRAPSPVWAQGLARVSTLVTDADSPLYQEGQDLRAEVLGAIEALDGRTG